MSTVNNALDNLRFALSKVREAKEINVSVGLYEIEITKKEARKTLRCEIEMCGLEEHPIPDLDATWDEKRKIIGIFANG